jgi:cell division protein FtsI (penicillin-binding protein 3)
MPVLVERRIGLLFAFFLSLIVLAGMRSLQLGTLKGGSLRAAAAMQQVKTIDVPAHRGTITDRKGVELAVSEAASDITATPYLVKDKLKVAARIAPLLGLTPEATLKKLSTPGGYVWLGHRVPGPQADRIAAMRIDGIDLAPTQRRVYPRDWLASQVLGNINLAGVGYSGVEEELNSRLSGSDGQRRVVKDGAGADIKVQNTKVAHPGDKVELSLDANIQDKVEDVLKGVGKTYRPLGATAMVTDPRTGEILALANWPQVNANAPTQAPTYAQQNRAVGYTYEPGSTFKAVTVAGALEDGLVTPDTSFYLPSQLQIYDRTIRNAEPRPAENMTVSQILAQSDNVGAITIGQKLGRTRFDHYVRRFGFGTRTGTDLPGEEQGIVRPLSEYSGTSMGNLPIGQGESVTPVQIAQFYGAIANGGVMKVPHVVRRVDGRLVTQTKSKRIMKASTAAALRQMLEGVFKEGGTAHAVQIPGYTLAGKTGTANKVDPKTGTYSETNYIASFVGFAPANNPKLLISVMVDQPEGGSIFGAEVAAPAFGKIASFALGYEKIPPQ